MLELRIRGYRDACRDLAEDPNYHVISIRQSSMEGQDLEIDELLRQSPSSLPIYFDDIVNRGSGRPPNEAHVRAILNFAEGKDRFLIHCAAGISRSSASAYLIACTRMPAVEATQYLEPGQHWPNRLMLQIGARLLDKPELLQALADHPAYGITNYFIH